MFYKKTVQRLGGIISRYYLHTKTVISSKKDCGVIDKRLFAPNIKAFTESLKYNSCLNGKISVDSNGEIRNCPSMPTSYGNLNKTSLKEALYQRDFRKYWTLTKNDIEICRDCEFRYICTDCRAYLENPANDKSKPLKCGYDPYTGKWSDWRRNGDKQIGIEYYDLDDKKSIDQ